MATLLGDVAIVVATIVVWEIFGGKVKDAVKGLLGKL